MKSLKTIICSLILLSAISMSARVFRHPGILHDSESLERIADYVRNGTLPAIGSYEKLSTDPKASYGYEIKGPKIYATLHPQNCRFYKIYKADAILSLQ